MAHEPLPIRAEEPPPDDAVVVIRAGVMSDESVEEAASRYLEKYGVLYTYYEGQGIPSMQALCLLGAGDTLHAAGQLDVAKQTLQRGIALAIARTFAHRLREALMLVEDLAFRDVTSRLAKILLEGQAGSRLTQELLAAMAGSRREVVGRALKALSQEGAVRLERGRIHVVDRDALERLAWSVT